MLVPTDPDRPEAVGPHDAVGRPYAAVADADAGTSSDATVQRLADAPRRILFLDDDPARAAIFLEGNPEAVWVQTAQDCLERLRESWDEVYLDHDLGGEHFVNVDRPDCGMEVVRWLCKEPRTHLNSTRFVIHSHNLTAALMMVLLMRETGYVAEFRPFGFTLELDPPSHPMQHAQDRRPVRLPPPLPLHRRLFARFLRRFGRSGDA